jgi:hypothetical protein
LSKIQALALSLLMKDGLHTLVAGDLRKLALEVGNLRPNQSQASPVEKADKNEASARSTHLLCRISVQKNGLLVALDPNVDRLTEERKSGTTMTTSNTGCFPDLQIQYSRADAIPSWQLELLLAGLEMFRGPYFVEEGGEASRDAAHVTTAASRDQLFFPQQAGQHPPPRIGLGLQRPKQSLAISELL